MQEEERQEGEKVREARKDQRRAEKQGRMAITELSSSYKTRIVPTASDDITNFFMAEYPSAERVVGAHRASGLNRSDKVKLGELQASAASRDKIRARREPDGERLSELSRYTPNLKQYLFGKLTRRHSRPGTRTVSS